MRCKNTASTLASHKRHSEFVPVCKKCLEELDVIDIEDIPGEPCMSHVIKERSVIHEAIQRKGKEKSRRV